MLGNQSLFFLFPFSTTLPFLCLSAVSLLLFLHYTASNYILYSDLLRDRDSVMYLTMRDHNLWHRLAAPCLVAMAMQYKIKVKRPQRNSAFQISKLPFFCFDILISVAAHNAAPAHMFLNYPGYYSPRNIKNSTIATL